MAPLCVDAAGILLQFSCGVKACSIFRAHASSSQLSLKFLHAIVEGDILQMYFAFIGANNVPMFLSSLELEFKDKAKKI